MADLKDLREKIDAIDKEIVRLFEERMDISRQVAEYKIGAGRKVFDKEREKAKKSQRTPWETEC